MKHKEKIMPYKKVLQIIGETFFQDKLPIINGIIEEKNYFKINIDLNEYSMKLSKIDFSEKYLEEENYSDISISGKIKFKNYTISYGEGSYGGDGFIIVMDENNKTKWLMFHDEINPIEKLEIKNNKIIGINNCGIRYEFEVDWENI